MNTMLHLGLGSFHRAHQALYLHQLRTLGDTSWQIAAGHLRPDMPQTIAALQKDLVEKRRRVYVCKVHEELNKNVLNY